MHRFNFEWEGITHRASYEIRRSETGDVTGYKVDISNPILVSKFGESFLLENNFATGTIANTLSPTLTRDENKFKRKLFHALRETVYSRHHILIPLIEGRL
jgi:hypothetical protein